MKLEDIVFSKRTPTKKGTIIKNLIIIGIVLVVLVAFLIGTLSKLGQSLNPKDWQEVKDLLNMSYDESSLVDFSIGGVDEQSFKTKLTSSFENVGELYSGEKLNSQVLFGGSNLQNSVQFNKKDLTLLSRAYLEFSTAQSEIDGLFEVCELKALSLNTVNKQTQVRIVFKVPLTEIFEGTELDVGMLSTSGLPENVYLSFFGTLDNTKSTKNCVVDASVLLNNLSTDETNKVLSYVLGFYGDGEKTTADVQLAVIQFFADSLASTICGWQAVGELTGEYLTLSLA